MKVHIYYFENITETNLLLAVGTDNKVVQTFLHFECCYSYTKTWIFKQIIFLWYQKYVVVICVVFCIHIVQLPMHAYGKKYISVYNILGYFIVMSF